MTGILNFKTPPISNRILQKYSSTKEHLSDHRNHDIRRFQTAVLRIQVPQHGPARGHHRRAYQRRRSLSLGSSHPRSRRYTIRRRHLPRRAQVPARLPTHAADDEVHLRHVASQWCEKAHNGLEKHRGQEANGEAAVYPNGVVCISILHPPGDDPNHYETASERWSPIQSVEKILISVMSMIAEPNDESPANVDAARMWRERRKEYEARVRADVKRSLGL